MRASSKGSRKTSHRKTGDAIGYDAEIVNLDLQCMACDAVEHGVPIDLDMSLRSQTVGRSCLHCGRSGMFQQVR